MRVVLPLVAAV